MKIGELVGSFISTLAYENIPPPVVLEAKKAMLDCMGVSIAAIREPCLNILRSLIQRMGGNPSSTLLGTDLRTSPSWAALYNGTMAHALDYDDGAGLHIPLHPSVPVLPAVVALGECVGANGKSVLEAYIGGTEVECKVARGCSRESYDLGWHATGVFGTMGAAAASAKLLGLEASQVNMALGIALSLVGGSRENFGTMVKPLHAGMAAMNGVLSGLLAQEGYTATDRALEGHAGFGTLFGGKNLTEQCSNLGNTYHLANGFSIKKYPSCYATHSALDAIFELLKKHQTNYTNIKRINCWLPPFQVTALPYKRPKTPLEAKFSMEFLLAVACVYGRVELKHFSEDVLKDERVTDLYKRINVSGDAQLGVLGARVTIELIDNNSYSAAFEKPKGHPLRPLSMDEVKDKFRSCAGFLLSENETENVLNMILQIEELEKIGSLMKLLQSTE